MFRDDKHLMQIIERIVSSVGRRIDESTPMLTHACWTARVSTRSFHPWRSTGPSLSIRRFRTDKLEADDLVARDALTQPMLDFLHAAVKSRMNVIVSGGTGAGKTTFLNVLSGFISDKERVVTIEDAAELVLRQRHVVRLETRPPNIEVKGAVAARHLVINALSMRPDRIVVGEVRGEEALDMLQRPRQFGSRCALPSRHDGGDGQPQHSRARDSSADFIGCQHSRPCVADV